MRREHGFTLVEIIMVIILIAIGATIGINVTIDNSDATRYEKTRQQLEAIKVGIIGGTSTDPTGKRENFGYVGDWGSLPAALSNLTTSAVPLWTYDGSTKVGAGWKGPYIKESFTGLDPLLDAWGTAFVYSTASDPATITSYGANKASGGTGRYDTDIVISIPNSSWKGTVYGVAADGSIAYSGVTAKIYYPSAGAVTSASAVTSGTGSFSVANIPFGIRSVEIASTPRLGPNQFAMQSEHQQIGPTTTNYLGSYVHPEAPCCRLSLDPTNAAPSTDQTNKTTVYLLPLGGSTMPIYDGNGWVNLTIPDAGISVAVPALASRPFDVFVYSNNGAPTLEATSWTNDTSRATALVLQDGVLVKSGATTRRYLGTGRSTTVAGRIEDSMARRFLWNMYNRVRRPLKMLESVNTWNYTTATWRSANNDATNRVELVVGQDDAFVDLRLSVASTQSGAGRERKAGIALDATNTNSSDITGYADDNRYSDMYALLRMHPVTGYHFFQWVEWSSAGGTTTWKSNNEKGLGGSIDG